MTPEISDVDAAESHFRECARALGDALKDIAVIVVQGGTNTTYILPETIPTSHLRA
jgi:hypothetical protein